MRDSKLTIRFALLTVLMLVPAALLVRAQTYTVMHNFNGTNGCCAGYPSMLTQGKDGDIYGATTQGGTNFYGEIFKITPSGTLTVLHNFDLTHGGYPQGGLSMGTDGTFYGTTYQGGAHTAGTIFKITPGGTFTLLYSFANTGDGAYPHTPPVQAADGNLYGTTATGAATVLYKLTTAGVFSVVAPLPSQSYSPLLLGTDGKLYGTTVYSGTYNAGTVFQFTTSSKTLKTIYNFHNEGSPYGPLMQGVDGLLYGTCSSGGTASGGVVFKVSTSGTYSVLYNFSTTNSANGASPFAGVVQGSDKYIYGVTSAGGANKLGALFKISTTGTGITVLHSFDTPTGDTPASTPLLHTNGTIYGMAFHGGTSASNGVFYSLENGLKPFVTPLVIKSAKVGGAVHLLGQGFNTATGVQFGTTAGTYVITNDTFMTATVVAGNTTGQITVKEPGGNLLTPLKFKIVPTITSFTPTTGPVGTVVTITGMSFTGATAVKFGTVAATAFTVNSNTKITATVPTGAITATIQVSTPGGTATSTAKFTVE